MGKIELLAYQPIGSEFFANVNYVGISAIVAFHTMYVSITR